LRARGDITERSPRRPSGRRGLLVGLLALLVAASVSTPALALPPGFEDELVATVSGGPMDTAWTPDGRMLIPTKDGRLRIYQNGALLPTAALDLSSRLCTVGEQGLVGVAVHPNFAFNHWIYLYYIYPKYGTCNESEVDGPVGRVSRFTLPDTNIIDPLSEVVLFDTGARFRNHHTGGGPLFGKDGYLYVTVGDAGGQSLGWPQNLGRLDGKLLRLTDTGGIPAGNPFTGPGTARCNVDGVPPAGSPAGTKCQEIYSYGLRNPFRFAMDPDAASTRYYIQDVGQHTWEEVSEGPLSGANYGWQIREGPCAKDSDTDCGLPPVGMTDPVHWYHHGPDGAAVTGGAFVPNGVWPASYDDSYMLADYVFGKIWQVKPGGTGCRLCSPPTSAMIVNDFADIARVVSLRFGPDGALYYTSREGGVVHRIKYVGAVNRAPVARMSASPTAGTAPLTVAFDGSASSDPDGDALTYAWDFESDGTADASGAVTSHTYTANGTYTAKLTVSDGNGGTNSTTTRIDVGNQPPAVTIDTPAAGTLFRVGQQFTLHGTASDPEDGSLPASSLTWEVERVHATHTHPYLPPTSGNDVPLTTDEPEDLDAAKDSFFRIYLTATDSGGLTTTAVRDLQPHKVNLTFNTNPTGLRITAGGLNLTGPTTVVSWENYDVSVDAPNQTDTFGAQWTFDSWSDGGAQTHVVNTPATNAGYTATFTSDTQTLTFAPSDDAYVRNDMPTSNFGNSTGVDVDNSPVKHALFKFDVSGIAGRTILSAKLRLFCTNDSSVGGNFHRVLTNTWSEATVNWNTSPAHDPAIIAPLGPVAVGNWYEVDLSSAIAGDGIYSFKATSTSANGAAYTSSEGTAGFRPELRVVVAGTGAPDTTPPTAPEGLSAAARTPTQVDLNWTASTDDRGVTRYDIYRNGSFLASAPGTTYSDFTVSAGTLYRYVVRARDAAGNVSDPSNEASVTTPTATPLLFEDGFESGDFSRWTSMSGMTIESQDVLRGLFSARGRSTGQVTYAIKQLATARSEVYYRLWFKINDQGGSSTRFARLRTGSGSSGASIIGFYVSSAGKLGYTNYVASSTSPSTMPVSLFLWHELQVRVRINGAASEVEVWLDGVRVGDLSKTDNLGTASIGRVQIGDSSTGRTYDVLYDDVAVSTGFID
jgi:glucose/arabinose dehydrogenase/chitodextrinase